MSVANGLHVPWDVIIEDPEATGFGVYQETFYGADAEEARREAAEMYPRKNILSVQRRQTLRDVRARA